MNAGAGEGGGGGLLTRAHHVGTARKAAYSTFCGHEQVNSKVHHKR